MSRLFFAFLSCHDRVRRALSVCIYRPLQAGLEGLLQFNFFKKSGNPLMKRFCPTNILSLGIFRPQDLRQCRDPGELRKCRSRCPPIEAVLRACAVALCTTAISKYGGGRRQCCEAVSLSLIAVRVKTNAGAIAQDSADHAVAGLTTVPIDHPRVF